MLLGLWYALNWCRELGNCFATQLQPDGWVVGGYCGMDGWASVNGYSHQSRTVQRWLLSHHLPALLLAPDALMCLHACTCSSGDQELQLKLLARLRCCCQLEALLDALLPVRAEGPGVQTPTEWSRVGRLLGSSPRVVPALWCCRAHRIIKCRLAHWPLLPTVSATPPSPQHAPPLFVLPPLGNTLDANPATLAAAALAAAPKKAAGKGGKAGQGGGKKKKGVKFAGDEDTSPAKSGRTGAASRSQQHTTSGGVSGTTQTHSGGTTQAGVAATQAVAVAAAGGLGRIAQERSKERSLLLPALATLGVGAAAAQEQPCYAALPSAAYVLADLHGWVGAVRAGVYC